MTAKVLAEIWPIYKHENKPRRVIRYAQHRINDIEEQIKHLELEEELMKLIITRFEPDVCPDCYGNGHIMKPIPGCECDGPRMHPCETCNNTGLLKHD